MRPSEAVNYLYTEIKIGESKTDARRALSGRMKRGEEAALLLGFALGATAPNNPERANEFAQHRLYKRAARSPIKAFYRAAFLHNLDHIVRSYK
jgi:hypothetical protein